MEFYVGIDLGGTYIKAGLVSAKGEIIKFARIPTQSSQPAEVVLNDIEMLIAELLEGQKGKLCGIGIGIPGLVDGTTLKEKAFRGEVGLHRLVVVEVIL